MPKDTRLLVHTEIMPMRWGDMDALGHINNTVYFRYMEQARIGWIIANGFTVDTRHPHGPVIVNASCTFLKPLVYPGEVEVRMYLDDLGRTSVGSWYELICDRELYAEGAAKIVWMDYASGKSVPLPVSVIDLLTMREEG
jgi:acyl-CoA thioester hydrolase